MRKPLQIPNRLSPRAKVRLGFSNGKIFGQKTGYRRREWSSRTSSRAECSVRLSASSPTQLGSTLSHAPRLRIKERLWTGYSRKAWGRLESISAE